MIVIVTGTPGTGKTTLAKELANQLDFKYISDKELIKKYDLEEEFDEERQSSIIDEEQFAVALGHEIGEDDVIVDSHLSHFIESHAVALCIVTTCELPTLKKRLEERDYSEEKVRENLDVEIFETCLFEAQELGHNVLQVSTENQSDELIADLVSQIKKLQEQ